MYDYRPDAPTAQVGAWEPDAELRERLQYVCGKPGDRGVMERLVARIASASGDDLDKIADEYNLRRRKGGA